LLLPPPFLFDINIYKREAKKLLSKHEPHAEIKKESNKSMRLSLEENVFTTQILSMLSESLFCLRGHADKYVLGGKGSGTRESVEFPWQSLGMFGITKPDPRANQERNVRPFPHHTLRYIEGDDRNGKRLSQ